MIDATIRFFTKYSKHLTDIAGLGRHEDHDKVLLGPESKTAASASDSARISMLASREALVGHSIQSKNSTAAVSTLYIAPVILIVPFASSSARIGLSFRMPATVSSTFFRPTASTKP